MAEPEGTTESVPLHGSAQRSDEYFFEKWLDERYVAAARRAHYEAWDIDAVVRGRFERIVQMMTFTSFVHAKDYPEGRSPAGKMLRMKLWNNYTMYTRSEAKNAWGIAVNPDWRSVLDVEFSEDEFENSDVYAYTVKGWATQECKDVLDLIHKHAALMTYAAEIAKIRERKALRPWNASLALFVNELRRYEEVKAAASLDEQS